VSGYCPCAKKESVKMEVYWPCEFMVENEEHWYRPWDHDAQRLCAKRANNFVLRGFSVEPGRVFYGVFCNEHDQERIA